MAARLTTFIVVSIVVATFIAGIITRAQREEQGPVDLIVLNGRVYEGDGKSFAEAVAVRGNRIVLVGSNREVKRLRRPQTTVIDAHGGAVLPGFNDAHLDFLDGSLELMEVDISDVVSYQQLTDRLRAFADVRKGQDWIVGRGWEPSALAGPAPTCKALDEAVPDHPVYLSSADGHSGWASCSALALAKITRRTRNPRAGVIVRDANGQPTGVLKDAAVDLLRDAVPELDREEKLAALRAGIEEAHRLGVTSVQTAGTAEDVALWDDLREAQLLTLRAYQALTVSPAAAAADVDRLEEIRREYGDDPLLKTGSVQITAVDFDDARELASLVTLLDRRGWQVWIRTVNAEGVHAALDALQAAADANPAPAAGRRHRLEHESSLDSTDLERIARLGVIASVHPSQAAAIATSGARLAFGSGWPALTMDPRAGLREAFDGLQSAEDGLVAGAPGMTLSAAVDAYTSGSAYASFDEQRKGTLAPGRLADLVILSSDMFTDTAERLPDVRVEVTIFDGDVVYRRGE